MALGVGTYRRVEYALHVCGMEVGQRVVAVKHQDEHETGRDALTAKGCNGARSAQRVGFVVYVVSVGTRLCRFVNAAHSKE